MLFEGQKLVFKTHLLIILVLETSRNVFPPIRQGKHSPYLLLAAYDYDRRRRDNTDHDDEEYVKR